MYTAERKRHEYYCWLNQIRNLGRKSIFTLLMTAGERTLFSEEGMSISMPGPGDGEKSGLWSVADPDTDTDMEMEKEKEKETEPCLSPYVTSMHADPEAENMLEIMASGAELLYTAPESQLRFLCGEAFPSEKKRNQIFQLLMAARRQDPSRIAENLDQAGIRFSCFLEPDFPARLRTIPDPPFGLYCRGNFFSEMQKQKTEAEEPDEYAGDSGPERSAAEMEGPAAAIIGARLASGYGREQARRFSHRLASRGITVISGMARGIDGIAQKAALDAGGKTIAVLGCGVDICYPDENRNLYERLLQEGGLISEYVPGTPPDARLFPQRNRIISGLSDLVLVIEARKRSGTLITVDMALEQGREVFALPGRVSDALSDGCNRLIRQGAGAATCPEDILEYFFGTGSEEKKAGERKTIKQQRMEQKTTKQECVEQSNINQPGKRRQKDQTLEKGNPGTLAWRILRLLTTEDEKHIDRILEDLNQSDEASESLKSEVPVSLPELVSCLMRLKMDGRVEESPAGYYRKI